MESTIKKIYEKELGYRVFSPDDKEFRESKEEYDKFYDALSGTLNDDQKKLLFSLADCESEVEGAVEYLSFKDGFFAGLRLGIELCEEEK